MSLNNNPPIVTAGLELYYDMNNTKKSWAGTPTTNQFTLPTAATNGFGVQSDTFTRIYSGTYGDYTIQSSDYVWRYNINGTACPYHGWDIPTVAGAVVTFSFDYYISPTTVGYPSTNYLANFENAGSGVTGSYSDPTPLVIGVWKRAYFSSTATATGNSRCLLYPGSCGGQLATGTGFILYKNPQVEFNAPGGIPTPFVAGTRSVTQSLLDLTNKNAITASSLTYNSDGSFGFNGSSNYIDFGNASYTQHASAITMAAWVNPVSTSTLGNIMAKNANSGYRFRLDSTANALWWYVSGNSIQGGACPNGVWSYCVVTGDSSGLKAYVNGSLVASNSTAFAPAAPSSGNLLIGTLGGAEYFNGKIASASVYNRALSAAEVRQNFNAHIGRYRGNIGSHPSYPAKSGYEIAQRYPSSPSGYYWIQSSAMPNPLLMYVDMSQEGGGYDFYAITNGTSIGATNATHSGTALGLDLVYPRSKQHWIAMSNYVRNVLGSTTNEYFQTTYAIHRTSAAENGGSGNYSGYIMRDPRYYGTGAPDWKVPDNGRWWLRDTTYTEPNGDYTAYNFLGGYTFANPYTGTDIVYNDVTPQTYVTGVSYLVSTNAKP